MSITFKNFTVYDQERLQKYSSLRTTYISERQFINQFIWEEYYNTMYYSNDKYLVYVVEKDGLKIPMMPFCKLEDIKSVFNELREHWNNELEMPFNMFEIDKKTIEELKTIPEFGEEFEIFDDRDSYDYIYDAEELKNLRGKRFHKKKNHLNRFLRTYEGRYEYRTINCHYMSEINTFYARWISQRDFDDSKNTMAFEDRGVKKVFQNCFDVDCRFGGVYVDGELEAFSIGTYDKSIECAFIHTEKANTKITGLYNYINQQFLINEFPEAKIVNREDDLGQEGLRRAKTSYRPIRLEEKYYIKQK